MEQSCARARIEWSNPAPTPGLTAGRVNGEKKHSVSDAARTDPLTDLRHWPGDGFFGQNSEVGIPTLVGEQRRNSDLGVAQARQAGGFYAGQVYDRHGVGVLASELETGTNHFLVVACVEFSY